MTVGINYIGAQFQLSGCINDSDTFISLLTEEFNYDVADIRQLRDDHPQRMPTRKNMMAALKWLVSGAKEGDHLFFHYSGHGSQQKDNDGDEMDGKDETLVPCDFQKSGMLSDDELRRILVRDLPKGVRLTAILDCCHSGTALDLPYKVICREGDLVDIKKKPAHKRQPPAAGDVVLLSGCMDTQTSADAGVGLAGNTKAAGAMTTAFKVVISKRPGGSYHTVVEEMRKFLKTQGFTQVPQLSSEHSLNLGHCFMPEAQAAAEPVPVAPSRPPTRKALTIGINYLTLHPGRGRLSGCINDSETMVGILKETFGFHDTEICRLRDDRANMMPTKANILASLRWLTTGASAGDELFLHYSGHGGQQQDKDGDEQGGKDDTLIPCDFQSAGQITDDELHAHIVEPLPKGVKMWVILDCCHSGTALDLPYKVQVSGDGKSVQLAKSKYRKGGHAEVVMLSGCKDSQTSADVQAGSMGVAKAAGAMTTAFRHCITPTIACDELILRMRDYLRRNSFQQVPQMSSEQYLQMDNTFIGFSGSGGTRDIPAMGMMPAAAPTAVMAQASPMMMVAPQPLSPMMQATTPVGHRQQASLPLTTSMDDVVMDTRINKLEAQIAELRQHTSSPMGMRATSPMRGAQVPNSYGPAPHSPMVYAMPAPVYPTYG